MMLISSKSLLAGFVQSSTLSLGGVMLNALAVHDVGRMVVNGETLASLAVSESLLTLNLCILTEINDAFLWVRCAIL